MTLHNTPQPHTTDQNRPFLADATMRLLEQQAKAAMRLLEQRAKVALPVYRWICGGCGMTHAGMLPEECESCGATALEFHYSSPIEIGLRS